MSTIGNVSGYDPTQIELLRQMGAQESGAQSPVRPDEMNAEQGANRIWSMLESRAAALGMDTETLSALQSEVKDAVLAALESQDTASGSQDGRQAVQEAILSTIAEHGIDTTKLQEDMEAHQGPPPGSGPPPQAGASSQDTSADAAASTTGSVNTDLLQWLTELIPLVDEEA